MDLGQSALHKRRADLSLQLLFEIIYIKPSINSNLYSWRWWEVATFYNGYHHHHHIYISPSSLSSTTHRITTATTPHSCLTTPSRDTSTFSQSFRFWFGILTVLYVSLECGRIEGSRAVWTRLERWIGSWGSIRWGHHTTFLVCFVRSRGTHGFTKLIWLCCPFRLLLQDSLAVGFCRGRRFLSSSFPNITYQLTWIRDSILSC